jgi:hypothetical protein
MKQFDMGNIRQQAVRLLDNHMNMLDTRFGDFLPLDGGYCQENETSGDFFKIGYNENNKLLSRVYNLEFRLTMPGLDFPSDFRARIRFRGFREIQSASFIIDTKDKSADGQLNDPELLSLIVVAAREVDLASIRLEYVKRSGVLTLSVMPYAGAYVWVKFPPAFYGMKLKKEEMNALCRLTAAVCAWVEKRREPVGQ